MPDTLLDKVPGRMHIVPRGAVAMIAEPMAFVAAESVMGSQIDGETPRYPLGPRHEVRYFAWPCVCACHGCGGMCCGPDPQVVAGTRVLLPPPGMNLHALLPGDLP